MSARRRRGLVVLLVALLVVVPALAALLTADRSTGAGPLDPDSAAPDGTRALAAVLRQQGVAVQRVERTAGAARAVRDAGDRATLVVADPDLLAASRLRAAATGAARVVLLEPGPRALGEVASDLRLRSASGSAETGSPRAGCADPDARAAGRVVGAGVGGQVVARRAAAAGARTCFGGVYATTRTAGGQRVAVLASAEFATNAHLASRGDAALALRALGSQPRVVWLMGSSLDGPTAGRPTLAQELPAPVRPVLVLALLVVLAVLVWRGRRLGPVVTEPLPVVVPAAETTTGRAALYRAAGSPEASAAALRAGARWRLAARLGLPPTASAEEVAAQVSGLVGEGAAGRLTGPPPHGGAGLLALATDLDRLEDAVAAAQDPTSPTPRTAPSPGGTREHSR